MSKPCISVRDDPGRAYGEFTSHPESIEIYEGIVKFWLGSRKAVIKMARLIYLMVLQILIGIWLVISPVILRHRGGMPLTTNSVIFGIVIILLGLGIALFSRKACNEVRSII